MPLCVRVPAGVGSALGGLAALLGRHALGAGLPALKAAFAPKLDRSGVLLAVDRLDRVLGVASGDVEDQLASWFGSRGLRERSGMLPTLPPEDRCSQSKLIHHPRVPFLHFV